MPTVNDPPWSFDADVGRYRYPEGQRSVELRSHDQDLRTAYILTKSEKSSWQTIVLLHGKNSPGAYWEPAIHEFIKHGFRVIAPDQFGFGKFSDPRTYQITFATLVENTRGLLAHLEVDHGEALRHSMGGKVATRFARIFADRTERLVLVSPIGLGKRDALRHDRSEFRLLTVFAQSTTYGHEFVQRLAEHGLSPSVRRKLGDYLGARMKTPPRFGIRDSLRPARLGRAE